MLTIYRRHKKDCPHRADGRAYRRCQCPIHVEGFLPKSKKEIRQSLQLRDWTKAQEKVREWESEGEITPEENAPITIVSACAKFLRDARHRELKRPTLYKYLVLFRRLRLFAKAKGLRSLSQLIPTRVLGTPNVGLEHMRLFRESWPDHNLSALKNLERLRAFLRFCQDSDWITDNPARMLKNPKITQSPTLPFTREEFAAIVAACDEYPDRAQVVRVRAFVLLLRYSGLRIGDVVTLRRDRIDKDGKLFLYTAKTGTAVKVPLPVVVIEALARIPVAAGAVHFFWTGESKPKSAVGDWQRSLARVFKLAKVSHGHAHRFRDTFAVEHLQAGVPLDRVSVLLGHQSVRVTERHYSPWVSARQEQLEADVRRTWNFDLQILGSGKHTSGTRGARRPN